MKVELHREPSVFETLRDEWNALLEKSVTRVPFLRAEYQRAWWRQRGGGEWPEASLLVATARAEGGELLGIAPLFFAKNRDGRPALLLVGSIEISDYLDFVVTRPQAEAVCAALLDCLNGPDAPAWEVLDFYNIPESSPTRAALGRAASAREERATGRTRQAAKAPCASSNSAVSRRAGRMVAKAHAYPRRRNGQGSGRFT